ncbi:MAG: SDR family oxidoreductase [Lachnospiraceae bacterium]|nr:SDR family oxidoreductase [Lachnospiraceae bacterium]
MKFEGKTVYITETNSAMGKAIAKMFASEGANLVLGQADDEVKTIVQEQGAKFVCVDPDLMVAASVKEMIDSVGAEFGRIDIFVHNNNRVVPMKVETVSHEDFRREYDYNGASAFFAAQQIGGGMAKYGNGKIIFVSSIHAEKPTGMALAYACAKGSLSMFVTECALQLGRRGIQTNAIEVGALKGDDEIFDTEGSVSGIYKFMKYRIPRHEEGKIEEIVPIVSFLASEDANYINGSSIKADGGFTFFYGFKA